MKWQIVFDVYGTLLDLNSPVARLRSQLGAKSDHFSDLWRAKQLEYAWVSSLTRSYQPFWSLTERALDYALETLSIEHDDALRQGLLDAYRSPDLYTDVLPCLAVLKTKGYKTAVFSNANTEMLEDALQHNACLSSFDTIISVDELKRYKPEQAAYQFAADRLQRDRSNIHFLSSNAWDIRGATKFGWRTRWVNRKSRYFEYDQGELVNSIANLVEFAEDLPSL